MTREEQVDWLCRLRADLNNGIIFTPWNKEFNEALTGILDQEPCEDAISRQAVEKITWEEPSYTDVLNVLTEVREKVRALPSVTPQPKTGQWIYDYTAADGHRTYHCSKCGCYLKPKHSEPLNSFKWCSLCGAKMQEVNG